MSLQETDRAAAANAVAPRVSLADIEAAIAEKHFALGSALSAVPLRSKHPLSIITMCAVVMNNGFTVIGKSAPASADNFNAELGRKFAYEDAVRQIWPLMGYALREKLAGG